MLQIKVVEKIKPQISFSIMFSIMPFMRYVKKCGGAGETTDDNIKRSMRFTYCINKTTGTHSEYLIFVTFSRQKWFRERASICAFLFHAESVHRSDCRKPMPRILFSVPFGQFRRQLLSL
jgi:hypothetical protein